MRSAPVDVQQVQTVLQDTARRLEFLLECLCEHVQADTLASSFAKDVLYTGSINENKTNVGAGV